MLTAADLARMPRSELASMIRAGGPVDPDAIADTEYRGVSLGLPRIFDRIAWKTFKKVFFREPASQTLRGWNVRIEQTGVDPPFRPKMRRGERVTFGHYGVHVQEQGLLLDYGRFGRGLDPMRFARDPVIAVRAGDVALLLGMTYLDMPWGRMATPSFFSLELDGPLTHRARPRPARD